MTKSNLYNSDNTKKSISYYVPDKRGQGENFGPSFYSHMLIEDLHLGIMPIRLGRKESAFKVELRADKDGLNEMICEALSSKYGTQNDISEALCDFIDTVAHTIGYYGEAFYEMVYFFDESKTKISNFILSRVPNSTIKNAHLFYWQFIPKNILRREEESNKRFVFLKNNEIVRFSMPQQLGGALQHKFMLRQLKYLGRETIPEFMKNAKSYEDYQSFFNFSTYAKSKDTLAIKLTRNLGWNARQKISNEVLEFYVLHKYLKFEKTKAILRTVILDELNKSLRIAGERMGFSAEIRMSGLPTAEIFDTAIQKLVNGELPFSDILKITKIK